MNSARHHAAGVALLLALACNGEVTEPPPRSVLLYQGSGNHQAAEVATNLAEPLVVEIRDASGIPVKDIEVRFESAARGSRSLLAASDSLGRAWVWWQLGEVAGPQVIRATADVPDGSGEVQFEALALAGPPAAVMILSASTLVAAPGTELDTLDVLVTDRFANATANVPLSWTIEAGGGTIRALSNRTDSGGRARAIWRLGPGAEAQSVLVAAGNTTRRIVATFAPVFSAVQVVSGSDHSCALTADGVAYCWGSNTWGQLGVGSRDWSPHAVPNRVRTSVRFTSLSAGVAHTCGLALDGSTWCWGLNRAQQAGSPATELAALPTRLTNAPAFSMLAAGGFHTCGLTRTGVAYCWGDDALGQLGRDADRSKAQMVFEFGHGPGPVAGSLVFSSIAATWSATCGVTASGTSYCWGENYSLILGSHVSQTCRISGRSEYDYDELWVSDNPCRTSPLLVDIGAAAASLVMNHSGACARLTSSGVSCWGASVPGPTVIPAARVSGLWLSEHDVCGVAVDDSVACWGQYSPFPRTDPLGGLTLVDLSTSGRHTCGLTRPPESAVYCWGTNYSGELGDGTTTQRNQPAAVISP